MIIIVNLNTTHKPKKITIHKKKNIQYKRNLMTDKEAQHRNCKA